MNTLGEDFVCPGCGQDGAELTKTDQYHADRYRDYIVTHDYCGYQAPLTRYLHDITLNKYEDKIFFQPSYGDRKLLVSIVEDLGEDVRSILHSIEQQTKSFFSSITFQSLYAPKKLACPLCGSEELEGHFSNLRCPAGHYDINVTYALESALRTVSVTISPSHTLHVGVYVLSRQREIYSPGLLGTRLFSKKATVTVTVGKITVRTPGRRRVFILDRIDGSTDTDLMVLNALLTSVFKNSVEVIINKFA